MSKNIFQVLAPVSDDEDNQKAVQQPHRPSKKERREADHQLREIYGDNVQKDIISHKRSDNPPKSKGDYAPGEKRPFERRSGTGQPAFAKKFKKNGHGKGNAGKYWDSNDELYEDEEYSENPEAQDQQKHHSEILVALN